MRIAALLAAVAAASSTSAAEPGLQFTRLVAHWDGYSDPGYLKFIEDARPEVVQVGFYGAHFYSLAHTPHGKGYPAHFPVQGLAECGKWFEDLNAELHKRRAKVVGHFNVEFLVGDIDGPKGPTGFFKFYRDLWDESVLGPRPSADPRDLLERKADGTPNVSTNYSIGGMREHWGCLNNPKWRAVLKAWVKAAVARGVDGLIANYFYRHDCLCEHCREGFRKYLAGRHSGDELRALGIIDLAKHEFTEIVGWHDPKQSTPLRREMLRFSQIACKAAFDEVFLQYGRSLKPDLIVAQWNHLGDFNQINGDERCLLPAELWGRGEDYLWYSTGGAANSTELAAGYLGEATLQARYIRGAFDGKPFTLGKYESTRIRVAIAELAANGGAPMGFYTRFTDPEARREIVRDYNFLERYDALYRGARPHAEVLLPYPRSRVHAGDLAAVEAFKEIGKELLDDHVLFDVRPDDLPAVAGYRATLSASGGRQTPDSAGLSRFEAPKTVRVSASRTAGGEIVLHFVNYNRTEPSGKRSPGKGIADEKPIAVGGVKADFVLPAGAEVLEVLAASPEKPDAAGVKFESAAGRVRFEMPEFLVYSIARIKLKPK